MNRPIHLSERPAREMRLLKVPVSEWLSKCMPGSDLPAAVIAQLQPFPADCGLGDERAMCSRLCACFNALLESLGSHGYTMSVTYINPEESDNANEPKPGLALCRGQDVEEAVDLEQDVELHADDGSADETPIRYFFNHTSVRKRRLTITHPQEAMDKLILRGRELCTRQHRFYAPMIYFFKGRACLLLIDREAAVVSESFNYLSDPIPLATFLCRYVSATSERRGYDPTITLASYDEHMFFIRVQTQYPTGSYFCETFKKAATPGWHTYKHRMHAQWSEDTDDRPVQRDSEYYTREFLIGRPVYDPAGGSGRCTQGFAAWDISRQRSVFIKDYWRPSRPDTLTEYEVYLRLAEGGTVVRNIPTVLGGGDVLSSSASAEQRPACARGSVPLTHTRIHTRLVFKEICRPLHSFRDWRELVSAVYDALIAHKEAWEDHGILHRDLSIGNIVIFDGIPGSSCSPSGFLVDWESSGSEEHVSNPHPSRRMVRSMCDCKPHLLSDDLESFMHILNLLALRHMVTQESKHLDGLMEHVHHLYDKLLPQCAPLRQRMVQDGIPFFEPLRSHSQHPFVVLTRMLAGLCKRHYNELGQLEESTRQPVEACEPHGNDINPRSDAIPHNEPPIAPLFSHAAFLAAFEDALQISRWPVLEKKKHFDGLDTSCVWAIFQQPDADPSIMSDNEQAGTTGGPRDEYSQRHSEMLRFL
ncbi:hypothetical protein ACG7TL_001168 [Trametes sanguinea]